MRFLFHPTRALPLLALLCSLACSLAAAAQTPPAAQQMHDALAAAQHGNAPEALRLVAALLVQQPSYVPALKLQAVLLEDAGNQPEAARSYARALELAPADPELQLKVGTLELLQGHDDRAVELLRTYTAAQPQDDEGFFYLAQALHGRGDDAAALKAIRRAAQIDPASAPIAQKFGELLCSAGDCTEALVHLQAAQKLDPTLPRMAYDLAFASFSNQDLDHAVSYATQATQQQPADLDAFALLGSAQIKLEQWSDAEPTLQHVLAARPQDSSLLLQLGHCQLELKQYQPAVDSLNRSLAADPTQALAHFFLARAYTALGNPAQARHESALHARMMQEFSFDVPLATRQHEEALTEQARRLLELHQEPKAVALFEADSQQAHGTAASAWVAVGATWLRMDHPADAQRALQHALELDPRVKGAYTYLGFMALEQGDLSGAEANLQAELKLDPNHPEALAELGEVRYRQSRWEEATQFLVRSKTSGPRFLFMLTDSYFHLGNAEAADLTAESLAAHAAASSKGQGAILASLRDLLLRNHQDTLASRLAPR